MISTFLRFLHKSRFQGKICAKRRNFLKISSGGGGFTPTVTYGCCFICCVHKIFWMLRENLMRYYLPFATLRNAKIRDLKKKVWITEFSLQKIRPQDGVIVKLKHQILLGITKHISVQTRIERAHTILNFDFWLKYYSNFPSCCHSHYSRARSIQELVYIESIRYFCQVVRVMFSAERKKMFQSILSIIEFKKLYLLIC